MDRLVVVGQVRQSKNLPAFFTFAVMRELIEVYPLVMYRLIGYRKILSTSAAVGVGLLTFLKATALTASCSCAHR
jgi:hypothetical protein